MDRPHSLFDRVVSRPRPAWVKITVSLFLLLLPYVIIYLSGLASALLTSGRWRFVLLTPAIIVYIWLLSSVLDRRGEEVVRSIREISPLDDESFTTLIENAQRIKPRNEWIAIGSGAILGWAINSSNDFSEVPILFQAYWTLSLVAMYAMMTWTFYVAGAGTRLSKVLFQIPLRINLFNLAPFEAIGRQGLLMAMAFLGGITLSLILGFQTASLTQPLFWVIYLALVLVALLIFFSSMRPAHQVLSKLKGGELSGVRRHLERLGQELMQRVDRQEEAGTIASEINALTAYEQRLKDTPTWPYNTGMLRTLFFSILMPLASVLAKMALDVLLP